MDRYNLEAGGNWLPDTMGLIHDACQDSPELFDGEPREKQLEIALEWAWGNGFHDDQAGDVDTTNHVFRVGRHVMETDSHGFTTIHSYGTDVGAQELVDFVAKQHEGCEQF